MPRVARIKSLLGTVSGQQAARQFANTDDLTSRIQQSWTVDKILARYVASERGAAALAAYAESGRSDAAAVVSGQLRDDFDYWGVRLAGTLDRPNREVLSAVATWQARDDERVQRALTKALVSTANSHYRRALGGTLGSAATTALWLGLCRALGRNRR